MASVKKRKTYLDGDDDDDENINYIARYRATKRVKLEEESRGHALQNDTHQQKDDNNETSIETVPHLSDSKVLDDVIPVADNGATGLYDSSSSDEECHGMNIFHNDCTALESLLQSPGFCDSITNPVQKSPAELLLMVLKYSLSNKLPLTSIENLLRLLNSIFCTPVTPDSRYMIDKLFNQKHGVEFHGTCPQCSMYLGKFGALGVNEKCENCQSVIDVSQPSSGNYFAIVDPSDAISEYLHAHEDYYHFVTRERRHEKGHLKDIYDGKAYRDFTKKLPQLERHQYVTATFNTDGAPVFESSTYSIWPIYLMINELPVADRFKNLIVCGLWFGKSKPQMSVFLDPFVKKINELSSVGIPCKVKGKLLNVKLYVLICCVDTIARSPMNGTMQFNAFYGCDWCLHPGEWFEGCVRYPVLGSICEQRDIQSTIALMRRAVGKELPILGVRNASPLINLSFFDIIKGFVPDYMHCILTGVVKQLTEYLIKLISVQDLKIVESRIAKIRVPNQLGRLSRPLKDRAMWKAREWENWLLYYSLPVLNCMVEVKFLKHWSLLVESLYTLLKTDITVEELDQTDQKLHEFVCGVEQLYTKAAMTYNVHQLLHVARSAYEWGPLWAHSTFPFEAGNHELLTAIQCAKGVNQQILRFLNMKRSVDILEKRLHPNPSDIVNQYNSDLVKLRTKKIIQISGITHFGSGKIIDKQLLKKFHLSSTTRSFLRIVKNSCLYASSAKENVRSCNSYAQLIDKTYVKIVEFVVDEEKNQQLVLYNVVRTTPCEFSTTIQRIQKIDDDVMAASTIEIDKVCVFLDVTEDRYISSVPNLYKY